MRKLFALAACCLLVMQFSGIANAWEMFNTTPVITGRVLDATTGQPLENVVISCGWNKTVPALVDNMTKSDGSIVVVTGKDGKYLIPSRTLFHFPPLLIVGSSFAGMDLSVMHPLYESQGMGVGKDAKRFKKETESGYYLCRYDTSYITPASNDTIFYDAKLMSLDECFKKSIADKRWQTDQQFVSRTWELFLTAAAYFYYAEKLQLKYDLDGIFKKWEAVAFKYSGKQKGYVIEMAKKETFRYIQGAQHNAKR